MCLIWIICLPLYEQWSATELAWDKSTSTLNIFNIYMRLFRLHLYPDFPHVGFIEHTNLVPRVLCLFGQRMVSSDDHLLGDSRYETESTLTDRKTPPTTLGILVIISTRAVMPLSSATPASADRSIRHFAVSDLSNSAAT